MPPVPFAHYVESLSAAIAVLTAMITPALLISASGMYILSTSNRLGRVVDRVRAISERMDELIHDEGRLDMFDQRKTMMLTQMRHQSNRARMLQRILTIFYVAACLFVLTSVAIGLDAMFNTPSFHVIPVMLGISGAFGLLYGNVMLIFEARMAVSSLGEEIAFLNQLVESDPHHHKKVAN